MTLRHCMAIALVATIAGAGSDWQDDQQHGLTPGPHEPTFQVSLD